MQFAVKLLSKTTTCIYLRVAVTALHTPRIRCDTERACTGCGKLKAALLKSSARGDAQLLKFKALAVGHSRVWFALGGAGSVATLGGEAHPVRPHDDHLDVGFSASSHLLEHHAALISLKAGGVVAFGVRSKCECHVGDGFLDRNFVESALVAVCI